MKVEQITKEDLLDHYVNQKKNMSQIARDFGVTQKTVKANLHKHDIEIRERVEITKEFLLKEYVENRKSSRKIGKEIGVSHQTILGKLEHYEIPKRTSSRLGRKNNVVKYRVELKPKDRFGKLTVDKKVSHSGCEEWKCHCDCGNSIIVKRRDLSKNRIKSCGCLKPKKHEGCKDLTGGFVSRYRIGAERRGIEFNIDAKEMWELFESQNRRCAISGVDLVLGSSYTNTTASLDRIDSAKHYTKDNIQWVHKVVNIMKGSLKDKDFVEWCSIISANKKGNS